MLGVGMAERQLRGRRVFHGGFGADVEPGAGIGGRAKLAAFRFGFHGWFNSRRWFPLAAVVPHSSAIGGG